MIHLTAPKTHNINEIYQPRISDLGSNTQICLHGLYVQKKLHLLFILYTTYLYMILKMQNG